MYRKSAEDMYEKAEDIFKSVPKSEIKAWSEHPATNALIHTLYGDLVGHFEGWANGNFTGPTNDETIQQNSKALGSVSAIELILGWMDDAKNGELYDD